MPEPTKDLRIGILITGRGSITLEIFQHRRRLVSNVAKVNGLATLAKEEKFVKQLEKLSRRLMNANQIQNENTIRHIQDSRAQDGLSTVCELTEECYDGPSRLGIETRRGLVKEKKKFGLLAH